MDFKVSFFDLVQIISYIVIVVGFFFKLENKISKLEETIKTSILKTNLKIESELSKLYESIAVVKDEFSRIRDKVEKHEILINTFLRREDTNE